MKKEGKITLKYYYYYVFNSTDSDKSSGRHGGWAGSGFKLHFARS